MATPAPPAPDTPVPPPTETTVVAAPPAVPNRPAAKKATAKKATAKQYLRFRSKAYPIHHPYQDLKVPISGSVKMEVDSWVDCQVAAGIIFEVAE